jgi:hypothetical protein
MKSFKLKDLMIQVQPLCGPGCSLSCNGNESVPCFPGRPVTVCSPTVCRPTVCHPVSVCENACTLTVSICQACSHLPSCVGCSAIACTAHPCSVFPCSAHPCSAFACSAHPCSANVCSALACSVVICSAHACSAIAACSIRVCSVVPTICPGITHITCPGGSFVTPGPDPGPVEMATTLGELKAQLQQQLAAIEEQEKATAESLKPQTVAEVDDLQAKLQGAMDELKARRAELEKQEKNKGKEPSK